MKPYWFFCCLFLYAVTLLANNAQPTKAIGVGAISFCEVAGNPRKYAGAMIAIRGSVFKGWLKPDKRLKTFVLTEPDASVVCPSARILAIMPNGQKQKPAPNVQRNPALATLERALHQRTAIEGVFEGRLDYKSSGKDQLRLVLTRVSNLEIHKAAHIDR